MRSASRHRFFDFVVSSRECRRRFAGETVFENDPPKGKNE